MLIIRTNVKLNISNQNQHQKLVKDLDFDYFRFWKKSRCSISNKEIVHSLEYYEITDPYHTPPWAATLTSRRGLIPSEPSASAERGTGRLSAGQLAGLV